jgi:voltage-gated potassium channel
VLLALASISILHFEHDLPAANIHTPDDALWWSLSTITTVGYGDRYPVSAEGRAVGALLMIAGVGLFATLSGVIAAWFLSPRTDREEELERLSRERCR